MDTLFLKSRRFQLFQQVLGIASAVAIILLVWLGLWVTPPSTTMNNLVRLLYVHPPVAWVAFMAFGVTALSGALYLWRRTRDIFWDRIAGASAEIGVVFCALTIVSGSLWGKATWGVWWTWDATLTSTAFLLVLYLGYLALRALPAEEGVRARRSAVAGLVAFLDVPIIHFSTTWWKTLHEPNTLTVAVHGSMAWTLGLGFGAFTMLYVWLLLKRYKIEVLNGNVERVAMATALSERKMGACLPTVNLADNSPIDRPGTDRSGDFIDSPYYGEEDP